MPSPAISRLSQTRHRADPLAWRRVVPKQHPAISLGRKLKSPSTYISKVRARSASVIAVRKLSAVGEMAFFLFKSPIVLVPLPPNKRGRSSLLRRASSSRERPERANFNGQNPFVLVPHINKKVARVKTRKKRREGRPVAPLFLPTLRRIYHFDAREG